MNNLLSRLVMKIKVQEISTILIGGIYGFFDTHI